jgi:leader peptidase (prepilin peptidase)/N-methyltransferase
MFDLFTYYPEVFYGFSVVLGGIMGSFLNVVIYRLPIMEENIGEEIMGGKAVSLSYPSSYCPNCKEKIKTRYNIPILGYFIAKGECGYCAKSISKIYPAVEFVTAVSFGLISYYFGLSIQAFTGMVLVSFLIPLTVIDFKQQLLFDSLTLPLLWLGLLFNVSGVFTDISSAVIGAAAGYLIFWSIYHLFLYFGKKEVLGYGDFKLFAALGAWFGWEMIPLMIFIASVTGIIGGIISVLQGKGTRIPFGPYLSISGIVIMFFGDKLLSLVF